MKFSRIVASAALALAVLLGASCADSSPTAPAAAAPISHDDAELFGWLGGTLQRTGLLACSPMPAATASGTFGPDGGVLRIGPHYLVIPRGALSDTVTITATAPSDSLNRVHFEPHGLQFQRSAALNLSYRNCNLLGSLAPKRIAYVDGQFNILEFLLSIDNLWTRRVTGRLDHFSDYVLSW